MNQYITGKMIKELREKRNMTQQMLANTLDVSDKTISKWETGKGFPDITMLEPIARALSVSVIELMAGESIVNSNRNFNMRKVNFYVCPVCQNVICTTGEAIISCCGITLPKQIIEQEDEQHQALIQKVEDEYHVEIEHEMSKNHSISFIAAMKEDGVELVKMYPEQVAQARFKIAKTKKIVYYCNKHGLFEKKVKP